MSHIVDDLPVTPEPRTEQDAADAKDERDSEAYQAMYAQVEAELRAVYSDCGLPDANPDGRTVHAEAMRRLRNSSG